METTEVSGGKTRRRQAKKTAPPSWDGRDDISPFKFAEKKFRRYQGLQTDFAAAIDVASLGSDAVEVQGHDGLYVLPGWLNPSEQLALAVKCLEKYPEPPHRTNLIPHFGEVSQVWRMHPDAMESLRWCTLGYQYDWTARVYPPGSYLPFPEELRALGARAAEACGLPPMNAEAAIVNYYNTDSTLGGHVDDAEEDMTAPIVSISLGCSAVFLVGGASKNECEPTALLLRSGDVVVMARTAREAVHGVPRVLTSGEDPKRAFEGLQDAWRAAACDSHHASTSVLRMERNSAHSDIKGGSQRDETYGSAVGVELQESNREQVANDRDSLLRVASFLEGHRINVNLRQVNMPSTARS